MRQSRYFYSDCWFLQRAIQYLPIQLPRDPKNNLFKLKETDLPARGALEYLRVHLCQKREYDFFIPKGRSECSKRFLVAAICTQDSEQVSRNIYALTQKQYPMRC